MTAISHREAPFCVLASTFLDGSYSKLRTLKCVKCSKQIWVPKQTSTRDSHAPICAACHPPRRQPIAPTYRGRLASTPAPDTHLLLELGVDEETYQLLRRLELRDITPSDYEVLLRLHAKASVRTCARAKVATHQSAVHSSLLAPPLTFGTTLSLSSLARVPPPHFCLFPATPAVSSEALADVMETLVASPELGCVGEQCTICLGTMGANDHLCRVSCQGRHVFHHACISDWLSKSSTHCPIDQQDLSK
jgi:hypothetical protein